MMLLTLPLPPRGRGGLKAWEAAHEHWRARCEAFYTLQWQEPICGDCTITVHLPRSRADERHDCAGHAVEWMEERGLLDDATGGSIIKIRIDEHLRKMMWIVVKTNEPALERIQATAE